MKCLVCNSILSTSKSSISSLHIFEILVGGLVGTGEEVGESSLINHSLFVSE